MATTCSRTVPAAYGLSVPQTAIFLTILFNRTAPMACGSVVHQTTLFTATTLSTTHNIYTTYDSINIWDDGYPLGGNYWSDCAGRDWYSGTFQNVTGSDGIADKPYALDQNNRDNFPIMKPLPWGAHDIGMTYIGKIWQDHFPSVFPLKTAAGLGFKVHFNVFVMNYGDYTETFNVTAYANNTIIGTITSITLAGGKSIFLNFTWLTTGLATGNYTISSNATQVSGETDTWNNTLTGAQVFLTIPGDLNGDSKVSLLDLVMLANSYGTPPGDSKWTPNADIDDNGVVGLTDLVILAQHYG